MARASAEAEGPPDPRVNTAFFGHEAARATIAEAMAAGRIPHGWMFCGPKGIGKATLAFRLARRLLAAPGTATQDGDPLAVPEDDPDARLVAVGSHPDLLVLERVMDDSGKRLKSEISVADVRRSIGFFGSTAARHGPRVAIVDAADDLNANAANALLKILEEPPANGYLILVAHAPGRLLPTIRSRCRRLMLAPLDPGTVREALAVLPPAATMPTAALDAAAGRSEGSIGRALQLLEKGHVELVEKMRALLLAPAPDPAEVSQIADRVAARAEDEAFGIVVDALKLHLSATARSLAEAGAAPGALAAYAEVWEKVGRAAGRAEALNLDRRQVVLGAFRDLAEARRVAATGF